MKKLFLFFILILIFSQNFAQNKLTMTDNSNKLAVLWTSSDPEVAEKMAFMYTYNAKVQGWFDEVVLIVWGPSAKLLTENEMLQNYIKRMQKAGIQVEACVACAKMYTIDRTLEEMNIDVKGMGVPLTNYLKSGWKTLTF